MEAYNPFEQQITGDGQGVQDKGAIASMGEDTENGTSISSEKKAHIDVISGKLIKLSEKVTIPVKQYPKFNFVGKLLGPKGMSLIRLQDETLTRMAILGKGSMRDKKQEEEYRKLGGKYAHLTEELHVLVEAYAEPSEAHSRLAHALSELKRYLIPELNDDIRQQQLEELAYMNGDQLPAHPPPPPPPGPGIRGRGRGRGRLPIPGRGGLLATPGGRGRASALPPPPGVAPRGGVPPRGSVAPRGRGAGRPIPGRAPARAPVAPVAPRYGEEDYAYGAESSYETAYSTATDDYYEYGHGRGYDAYGADSWARPAPSKAPPAGRAKTDYRTTPYSRPAY